MLMSIHIYMQFLEEMTKVKLKTIWEPVCKAICIF